MKQLPRSTRGLQLSWSGFYQQIQPGKWENLKISVRLVSVSLLLVKFALHSLLCQGTTYNNNMVAHMAGGPWLSGSNWIQPVESCMRMEGVGQGSPDSLLMVTHVLLQTYSSQGGPSFTTTPLPGLNDTISFPCHFQPRRAVASYDCQSLVYQPHSFLPSPLQCSLH